MNAKEIISHCENFYDIINFEPLEGDTITSKMINVYKEYIFKDNNLTEDKIEEIINLDKAMKRYIDDYLFRKDMQNCVLSIKINKDASFGLKEFISKIIDFFINYNEYTTRVIYISRWI